MTFTISLDDLKKSRTFGRQRQSELDADVTGLLASQIEAAFRRDADRRVQLRRELDEQVLSNVGDFAGPPIDVRRPLDPTDEMLRFGLSEPPLTAGQAQTPAEKDRAFQQALSHAGDPFAHPELGVGDVVRGLGRDLEAVIELPQLLPRAAFEAAERIPGLPEGVRSRLDRFTEGATGDPVRGLEAIGRPGGFVRGAFLGDPVRGFKEPFDTRLRPGIIPDKTIIPGTSFGLRDLAEVGLDIVTDPLSLGPGLATKPGRAAIGATARRATSGAVAGSTDAALTASVRESVPAVGRLLGLLDQATGARGVTEAARSRELTERAGRGAKALLEASDSTKGFAAARAHLRGELTPATLGTSKGLDPADIVQLNDFVRDVPGLQFYERIRANDALNTLLGLEAPGRAEIDLLRRAFGDDVANAALKMRTTPRKIGETSLDLLNIPITLLASGDVSFPFRQGIVLIRRKEWWTSWAPMFRALASEEQYTTLMGGIQRNIDEVGSLASRRADNGVDITTMRRGAKLTAREESAASSLVERVPVLGQIVRASNRAFTVFGNKLRADTWDNFALRMDARLSRGAMTGDEHAAALRDFGRWVNIATGRADLPVNIAQNQLMGLAQATIFSPKNNIARVQTLDRLQSIATGRVVTGTGGVVTKVPREVRFEIAKDLGAFIGGGLTVLGIMEAFGWADVDLDPKSADFGVAQVGKTRWDPWGGFRQFARLGAQLQSGKAISAAGNEYEIDWRNAAGRQIRAKLSPTASIVVDIATGETFLGEDITPALMLRENLLFLSVQDFIDGYEEEGIMGAFKAAPSLVGIGVSTFESPAEASQRRNDEAVVGRTIVDPLSNEEFTVQSFEELEQRVGPQQADRIAASLSPELAKAEADRTAEQLATAAGGINDADQAFSQLAAVSQQRAEWSASVQARMDSGEMTLAQARTERERYIREFLAGQYAAINRTFAPVFDRLNRENDLTTIEGAYSEYLSLFAEATGPFNEFDSERFFNVLEPHFIHKVGTEMFQRVQSNLGLSERSQWERDLADITDRLADAGLFEKEDIAWENTQAAFSEVQGYTDFYHWRDSEIAAEKARLVEAGVDPGVAQDQAESAVRGLPAAQFHSAERNTFETFWIAKNNQSSLPGLAREAGYISSLTLQEEALISER